MNEDDITLVDIGARGGLQEHWDKISDKLNVIMFEADKRECLALTKKLPSNFKVINAALSDKHGSMPLYLCRKRATSSVYKPKVDFLKKFEDIRRFDIEKSIKIESDTLDNQIRLNNISDVDFIKIDTQGHELNILKGSKWILKKTVGLELEVSFAEMHSGQPLFHEINEFMTKKGFALFDLSLVYWNRQGGNKYHYSKKGQLVWGDALYLRVQEKIVRLLRCEEKIIKAFQIYNLFGYLDISSALLREACDAKLVKISLKSKLSNSLEKENNRNKRRRINKNLSMVSYWRKGINEDLGNRI